MSRYPFTAVLILALLAPAAQAELFRCNKDDGSVLFSDKPCSSDAQTYAPRHPLVVVPGAPDAPDLAREYDQRVQKEKAARDKADTDWNKDYGTRLKQEERLGKARARGEVTVGMEASEVRRRLGEPLFSSHSENAGVTREAWTYKNNDGTRSVVRFKNGVVTEVTTAKRHRK